MTDGTIAGLLDEAARQRPNAPFLLGEDGADWTVADVARLSTAGAHWLAEVGVRPGMTVAWQLPAHPPAAVLMLALARAGVTQAPVLHLLRRREVAAAVEVGGADLLIVDETTRAEAPDGIPVLELPADFLAELAHRPNSESPFPAPTGHDPHWIYFTSGSTGLPKGVRHTDSTLLVAAAGYVAHLGLGDHPDDVGTLAFPIAHIGGIIYLTSMLIGGFPAVLVPKVDAATIADVLARRRVTISGSSPAFYQILLAAQLASGRDDPLIPTLRMLIGGGAPCPPELHEKIRKHLRVPVLHAYGMTEAPLTCVSKATDTDEQQIHSCGLPIPGARVRIAHSGEIELCGTNVTPGYVDAVQWAQTTTPDGWFRTGDCGYLRPDGRIVITGRIKDLIIRKGENISPDEIENELLAHPLIDDVAVVGLPDEERGELVCAVVKRSPAHRDVTLDEICAFLDRRGLMKQKWPERLVVVDEFPLTGLGKVAKKVLAEKISGGTGCPS